jgi:hypothetical protein
MKKCTCEKASYSKAGAKKEIKKISRISSRKFRIYQCPESFNYHLTLVIDQL